MKMKGKPDLETFLTSGAAEEKQPEVVLPVVNPPPEQLRNGPSRKKLIELPEAIFAALKDRAYQESKRTGERVTETSIILQALSHYLGK